MKKTLAVCLFILCVVIVSTPQDNTPRTTVQEKIQVPHKTRTCEEPKVTNASRLSDNPEMADAIKPQDKAIMQDKHSFWGFYKITLEGKGKEDREVFVCLQQKGDSVKLIELGSKQKLNGAIYKGEISERVLFSFGREEAQKMWGGAGETGLELTWSAHDGSMKLRLLSPNAYNPELKVQAVLSVWACDNHNDPRHTADSEEGMRQQTEKYGCKGWHTL